MHNIKGSGRFESEAWLLKQLTMAFFPSSLLFIFIFLILIFVSSLSSAKTQRFARSISPSSLGLDKPQKLSHLHFFFHDVVGGTNRTAVRVAAAPSTDHSPTGFGAVVMMDDPLTEQAEAASRAVGRAQGIYASASRTELGFLMALNFAFTEGKFNGSTLAVLGRNAVESAVREMPVVGGTGVFRFATGYAQARTHSLGALEAVVEYNVLNQKWKHVTGITVWCLLNKGVWIFVFCGMCCNNCE